MSEQTFALNAIAQVAHEANRAMQEILGEEVSPEWAEAPDWMRSSITDGIRGAIEGRTPEESHEAWMAERLAGGWRLGYPKSVEEKISPNLVPYAELPPGQRAKDRLLIAIATTLFVSE